MTGGITEAELLAKLAKKECCGQPMLKVDAVPYANPWMEEGAMHLCLICGYCLTLTHGQLDEDDIETYRENYTEAKK